MKRTILTLVLVCALIATVVPVDVFAFIEPSLHDQEKTTQILSSSANRLGAEQKISFSTSQFEYSFFANVNGLLIYKDVLDQIYTALVQGKYVVQQYSNQIGTISDVGFYFQDIDKDGNPELFIGSTDSYLQDRIMRLYTYCDGKIFEVASSDVRWGYYLTEGNQFYYFRSAGYADYVQEICELNDGVMVGKSSLISSNLSSILYYYSSESEPIHQISKSQYESYNQSFKPPIKSLQLTLFEKYDLNYIAVNNVSLSPVTLSLTVGNSSALTATVLPSNASNKEVRWSSSDPSVATVSNGLVTAVGEGTATITATTVDGGFSARCTVNVAPKTTAVTGIAFSVDKVARTYDPNSPVYQGGDLSFSIFPPNAMYQAVTVSSSNPHVATISSHAVRSGGQGIINYTLTGEGTTIITVTTMDGGYQASCELTVTRVETEPDTRFLIGEDTNQFHHFGIPYNFYNGYYYLKLCENASWLGKIQIDNALDGTEFGVCHGIALSMIYASQNLLDYESITPGAQNYWDLGLYYEVIDSRGNIRIINEVLADMLLYYNLTQMVNGGESTSAVYKGGWYPFSSEQQRLKTFLEEFVREVEKSWRPFVFGFNETADDYHSVVVFGYSFNSEKDQYEIKIYDENDRGDDPGDYRIMTISGDCSSFSFQDHNMEATYNTRLENVWERLEFWSCDKIFSDIPQVNIRSGNKRNTYSVNKASPSSSKYSLVVPISKDGSIVTGREYSPTGPVTQISITAYQDFYLENAEGKYLSYDGGKYGGNMPVYNCELVGLGGKDSYWNLTVDQSAFFRLRDADGDCTLIVDYESRGYAVSTDGADSVVVAEDGVTLNGTGIDFDISLSSTDPECIMYTASGHSGGSVTVEAEDGNVTIKSNKPISDFDFLEHRDAQPTPVIEHETSNSFVIPISTLSFSDVPRNAYYYDAVQWAVENGITSGTGASTFSPDATCTRAQMVTFLWRTAGCPVVQRTNPFVDVRSDAYYYNAVLWAVKNGITAGTSAARFSPEDTVTRDQAVTFLYRFAGSPSVSGGNAFRDVPGDAYYASAVQWAVSKQVTNGTGATTFSPGAPCTRAQTVTFLYRMQRLGVETTSAEGQSADDGKYGKITIGGHTVYIEFRDT